jgi:hypothetical protein
VKGSEEYKGIRVKESKRVSVIVAERRKKQLRTTSVGMTIFFVMDAKEPKRDPSLHLACRRQVRDDR